MKHLLPCRRDPNSPSPTHTVSPKHLESDKGGRSSCTPVGLGVTKKEPRPLGTATHLEKEHDSEGRGRAGPARPLRCLGTTAGVSALSGYCGFKRDEVGQRPTRLSLSLLSPLFIPEVISKEVGWDFRHEPIDRRTSLPTQAPGVFIEPSSTFDVYGRSV